MRVAREVVEREQGEDGRSRGDPACASSWIGQRHDRRRRLADHVQELAPQVGAVVGNVGLESFAVVRRIRSLRWCAIARGRLRSQWAR
jgi:hypothetical protein